MTLKDVTIDGIMQQGRDQAERHCYKNQIEFGTNSSYSFLVR